MADPESDAYDRGHLAGIVAQRLNEHDGHFQRLNGSLADMVEALHELTLAVQQLRDQATANAATVVVTAAALKDAEQARRDQSEQSWSPVMRLFALLGALAAVATIVGLYLATRTR